jgi:hypothetical protein
MGHELREKSNLEGGLKYYELALDAQRKANNGEDTYEVAILLENIGNTCRLKGELLKAKAYQEEAYSIMK